MNKNDFSRENCFKKALRYLSRYACSENRLLDYLLRKNCGDYAEGILQELKRKGFLDEKRTALQLAENYLKKFGKKRVEQKLLMRGFSKETVGEVLNLLSSRDELSVAIAEARKKLLRMKESDKKKLKAKLWRFLRYRGFEGAVSIKAVEAVLGEKEQE